MQQQLPNNLGGIGMSGSAAQNAVQQALIALETERERLRILRRRQLLAIGVIVSLTAHIVVALWLANQFRPGDGPGQNGTSVTMEFNILPIEDLTDFNDIELDQSDMLTEASMTDVLNEEEAAELTPQVEAADLEIGDVGAMPTLGGGGGEQGGARAMSGSGSGSGASFFGIQTRGSRICYIVDISSSMNRQFRMMSALRELARSMEALPDYAYFHLLFYSDHITVPPMQNGWTRARRRNINEHIRWLNTLSGEGGTKPLDAFIRAYNLDPRPDAIFFLTDGAIGAPQMLLQAVEESASHGEPVQINTIAFGNQSSAGLLQDLANLTGGTYRYVPNN